MFKHKPYNAAQVQTTSIRKRKHHLRMDMLAVVPDPAKPLLEFLRSLPQAGMAQELIHAAEAVAQAALSEKDIIWLIDDTVIKHGLSPIFIQLIDRGFIRGLAMTGSAAVCDFELASYGVTNEDLKSGLQDGLYGMARETGEGFNEVVNFGVKKGFSLGESLSRGLLDRAPKYMAQSILAKCNARTVTPTIHVCVGADGVHASPNADGAMLGKGSLKDLQILASRLEGLNEGGVVISLHNSQNLMEVFMRACAMTRNLGSPLDHFSVVKLGTSPIDYSIIPGIQRTHNVEGPIEILMPLFTAALFSLVE